jgi:hypothetical protein
MIYRLSDDVGAEVWIRDRGLYVVFMGEPYLLNEDLILMLSRPLLARAVSRYYESLWMMICGYTKIYFAFYYLLLARVVSRQDHYLISLIISFTVGWISIDNLWDVVSPSALYYQTSYLEANE